jgi:integrase
LLARVRWTDSDLTVHSKERKARNRSHAQTLIEQLRREIEDESLPSSGDITFAQMAEIYLKARVTPAQYNGERKVSGMRAQRQAESEVDVLTKHFGDHLLAEISYEDIEDFRSRRLSEPYTKATDEEPAKFRKISSVNHSLRRLRALLNFAIQRKLLTINPFSEGPSLISEADETPRNRPRKGDEEEKLLGQCTGRRSHLRAILIAAIDTAMRQGEILKLQRRDIDLARGLIIVRAFITKTATTRMVPISDRLREELERILGSIDPEPETLLFGGIKSIKTAFRGICKDAGVMDLNFHDLRHWATTDLVAAFTESGLAVHHVMRITGHTQDKTFRRYIRTDEEIVKRGGQALELLRKRKGGQPPIQKASDTTSRKAG